MTYSIYALAPRSKRQHKVHGVVCYIGKSDDPYRRVREHSVRALERVEKWAEEGGPTPTQMEWFLAAHWEDGELPKVLILETGLSEENWREAEKRWIALAKKFGITLLNKTEGG